MKARKSFVQTEDDSKINWSPNSGTMYAIVNKDKKNDLGEYPGYRILPGEYHQDTTKKRPAEALIFLAAGVAYLTVQNSSITKNAAHHTTHHLFVTKQKDDEARATNPYNSLDIDNPPVDFAKYFNGESLVQEDM
jgi:primary-amine oxidase